jgi:hypothetical protein
VTSIVKKLTAEEVPPFGAKPWSRPYVHKILGDRRTLGEFQPCRSDGTLDGDPIADYYPAAITEGEWLAARAAVSGRFTCKKGWRLRPVSKYGANAFQGLLRHARDGDLYYVTTRTEAGKNTHQRTLVTARSTKARLKAPAQSFPYTTFEAALLSLLREINPHEILNGDQEPDETLALAGELAGVEASIAALAADLEAHGDSPTLFQRIRQKESRKAELVKRLAAAREKALHPLSESWGEAQTLLGAIDTAPDPTEVRVRLRAALRRIVDSIWILVVPRGRDRLAAVQVWFAGGQRHRDYLILHRPKANGAVRREGAVRRQAHWRAWSLAEVVKAGDLDLRRAKDVQALETKLTALDLARLAAGGPRAEKGERG